MAEEVKDEDAKETKEEVLPEPPAVEIPAGLTRKEFDEWKQQNADTLDEIAQRQRRMERRLKLQSHTTQPQTETQDTKETKATEPELAPASPPPTTRKVRHTTVKTRRFLGRLSRSKQAPPQ